MKESKLKIFKIKDKIYEERIFLVVGDKEKIEEYVNRVHKPSPLFELPMIGGGASFTLENKGRCQRERFLWIESFSGKIFEIGLLNHEMLHLTFEVLKDLGFSYSKDSEEAYTYYLQWITVQVFGKLQKIMK